MIKKTSTIFFCSLITLISCSCEHKIEQTKILIIGDVQLNSNIDKYNKDNWISQTLDTLKFKKYFTTIIKKVKPDYIFQTGDWVNYNNNLSLSIIDTAGNQLDSLPLPYNEWEFMSRQIPDSLQDRFFISIGNHESYEAAILQGIYLPDEDILANIEVKEIVLYDSKQKKKLLTQRFPHLENAVFHNQTASYAVFNDKFTIVSIDGLDKNRVNLLRFIETQLSEHKRLFPENDLFVLSHYPIFTGRKVGDNNNLVYTDIRDELIQLFDEYKVDLYLNGHEHFYLRYKEKGYQEAQFDEPIPNHTKYITISNFSNPYARELERVQIKQNDDSIVYFNGIHYSVITITQSGSEFKTYGLKNDTTWSVIDSLKY